MRRLGAILIVALWTQGAWSGVYKCSEDGKTIFQDTPCADAAQRDTGRLDKAPRAATVTAPARPLGTADEIMATDGWDMLQSLVLIKMLKSSEVAGDASGQAEECLSRHRSRFKDPASAYIVESKLYDDAGETFVMVDVSAKNGFGGAARSKLICN